MLGSLVKRERLESEVSNEPADVREKILKGIKFSFAGLLVARSSTIFAWIFITKFISPAEYGAFSLILLTATFGEALTVGGISNTLVRVSGAVEDGLYEQYSGLQLWLSLSYAACLSLFVVPAFVFGQLLAEHALAIGVMCICFMMRAMRSVPRSSLIRSFSQHLIAKLDAIDVFSYALFSVLLAYYGFGLWSLVIAHLIRNIIHSVLLYLIHRIDIRLRYQSFKEIMLINKKDISLLQGYSVLNWGVTACLPIIIAIVLSKESVAIVALSLAIANATVMQPITLLSPMILRIFSWKGHEGEDLNSLHKVLSIYAAVGLPYLFILMLFGVFGLKMFLPEQWMPVAEVMPTMILGFGVQIMALPMAQYLKYKRYLYPQLIGQTAIIATLVGGVYLFAPNFGLLSVMVVFPLAYGSWALILAFAIKKINTELNILRFLAAYIWFVIASVVLLLVASEMPVTKLTFAAIAISASLFFSLTFSLFKSQYSELRALF